MTSNIQPDDQAFGPFTVAEVEGCFNAFDLDGNGFVGAPELVKVYQHLGETATDEEIDEMIKMCDMDGDGQITFDEFAELIFRHSGKPKMVEKPQSRLLSPEEQQKILSTKMTKKTLRPIQSSITGYGSDNNNEASAQKKLTVQERADRSFVLKSMMKQINFDNKNIDDVHAAFLRLCPNNGIAGLSTYPVFCTAIGEQEDSPICRSLFNLFQPVTVDDEECIDFREFLVSAISAITTNKILKTKYVFDIFDVDRSGTIDKEELCMILKATNMAIDVQQVQSQASTIMKQTDANSDGQLTLIEFSDVVNKFPNLVFPALDKSKKKLKKT